MSNNRATRGKLGAGEEIAELLKRRAVLQRDAHQAGHHVVKANQFRGTVRTFHARKDFGWVVVVMDGDVEGALAGDFDFLRDVMTAGRKNTTLTGLSYIGHAFCNSL